jgi:hypothetical protein
MKSIAAQILQLAAALAITSLGAYGQEITTITGANPATGTSGPGFNAGYSDGDLILAFASAADLSQTSGVNSQGDLLFNLGLASSFTNLAAGTYSVAGFNGSAMAGQPAMGSGTSELTGNLTAPSDTTFWSVFGSLTNNSKQLWLAGVTAQRQQSASTQSTLADIISSIGFAGAAAPNAGNASAFDSAQTTGNYGLSTLMWQNFSAIAFSPVSATSNEMGLYSLLPGVLGGGSSTELGYFTLADTSGKFSLTFTATPAQGPTPSSSAASLVNISSRADVGTGTDLEIAGFVIAGPPGSTEQVLVRGAGPTLSQFGVAGFLTNPILTLYDSAGNPLATNTGWTTAQNASEIEAATTASGAFAFPSGSADSAILVSLAPGAYTAEIVGANGDTGVALAEVYKVGSGSTDLINVSTRAFVGLGSSVEIGGFVVQGTQAQTVLVRAVGPTLSQFGVTGTLAQPSLNVVDSAGNVVATNVGWANNSNAAMIASESQAVGAFPLASGSADCALLLSLSPGAYTAIVSGVNGTTGVALVEIYKVP